MAARNSRCISVSDEHSDLLDRVAKENRMSVSEVVRRFIDYAISNSPELNLPMLKARLSTLDIERASIRQEMCRIKRKAKETEADPVFTATSIRLKSDDEAKKSPEGLVEHYIKLMGKPDPASRLTPTVKVAANKLRELFSEHPEFEVKFPDTVELIHRLEGGGLQ